MSERIQTTGRASISSSKGGLSPRERRNRRAHLALLVVMAALGVIFVLPFIWMVIVTFEGQANIIPPVPPKYYIENPSLFNLKIVTENGQLLTSYINSFFVAVCSVALNLFSVLMGGYALSKGRFRGKGVILMVILSTMMIPFETRMIPMFTMFNAVGAINTFWPIILPSVVDGFGVLMARQYFDELPGELRESAAIDGAGEARTFFGIYLPIAGPLVSTLAILTFLNSWNNFLWPLVVLTRQELRTIPLFISSFSMENSMRYMGTTMAVAFMAIIPVMIVYLFLQKYIIQSVATSGIKG